MHLYVYIYIDDTCYVYTILYIYIYMLNYRESISAIKMKHISSFIQNKFVIDVN